MITLSRVMNGSEAVHISGEKTINYDTKLL